MIINKRWSFFQCSHNSIRAICRRPRSPGFSAASKNPSPGSFCWTGRSCPGCGWRWCGAGWSCGAGARGGMRWSDAAIEIYTESRADFEQREGVKIVFAKNDFDGKLLHLILTDTVRQKIFINNLVDTLSFYNLQGINIDFEDIIEPTNEPLTNFQKRLYQALHAKNNCRK